MCCDSTRQTSRNIEKASHTFVVDHLLIDTEAFVWPYNHDNTKTGNSVKQISSVLHIRGCVHLPLQQVFKIIMSPDSTFYKLPVIYTLPRFYR